MKKQVSLALTSVIFYNLNAQVGINTDTPNINTLFHVSERSIPTNENPDLFEGVLIPRYSTQERHQITFSDFPTNSNIKLNANDNGLTIYNTDENCYNYWDGNILRWKKMCGNLGSAIIDFNAFNCDDDVEVRGNYTTETGLTTSEYIKINVDVTDIGSYDFKAYSQPANGYYFSATGEFLSTGIQTVFLYASGVPTNSQIDSFTLTLNGTDVCEDQIKINVNKAIKPLANVKLLDVGDSGEAAYAFATTWFKAFMNSWSNFGPITAYKVRTDGSPLAPDKISGSTSDITTFNQYDIIALSYRGGVDITNNQADALYAWVMADPKRTLLLHPETYGPNFLILLNQLIGNGSGGSFNLTSSNFVSLNSTGATEATSASWVLSDANNDPFMKGIFGDLTGTVHLDHGSSFASILKSKLDESNNIQYMAIRSNGNPAQDVVSIFKIKDKNVIWLEDGAPFHGSFTTTTGPSCFTPQSGIMGAIPIKCSTTSVTNNQNSGGSIFAANMIYWAIQQL